MIKVILLTILSLFFGSTTQAQINVESIKNNYKQSETMRYSIVNVSKRSIMSTITIEAKLDAFGRK